MWTLLVSFVVGDKKNTPPLFDAALFTPSFDGALSLPSNFSSEPLVQLDATSAHRPNFSHALPFDIPSSDRYKRPCSALSSLTCALDKKTPALLYLAYPRLSFPSLPSVSPCEKTALPCFALRVLLSSRNRCKRPNLIPLPHLDSKSRCRPIPAQHLMRSSMSSTWQKPTRRKAGLVDCPPSLPTVLSHLWPTTKLGAHRSALFSRHTSGKAVVCLWGPSNISAWWTAGILSICPPARSRGWRIIISCPSRGGTSISKRPLIKLELLLFRFHLSTCYKWAYRKQPETDNRSSSLPLFTSRL